MVISNNYHIPHFISLYKWENLEEDSPMGYTRNRWLWLYGGIAKYNGIGFPCMNKIPTLDEIPQIIVPVIQADPSIAQFIGENKLPAELWIKDCEAYYCALPFGMPIISIAKEYYGIIDETTDMRNSAIRRSMETAIVSAGAMYQKSLKQALNTKNKDEGYVVTPDKDKVGLETEDVLKVVNLPSTIDRIDKLWSAHDGATQELHVKLGFAYNPEKRERMIVSEMEAQNHIIESNREMLEEFPKYWAKKNGLGETVEHVVNAYLRKSRELQMTNNIPMSNPVELQNGGVGNELI